MIDYNNIERWITINGNHIPVMKGQSEEEAFQSWLSKKEISDTADTDDIDIDIELEDEDIKMPYQKKLCHRQPSSLSTRIKRTE